METANLTNHFLIATPSLKDPTFSKTVTYICEHNNKGALGIIINRPIQEIKLDQIFTEMEITITNHNLEQTVYSGGPVHPEQGFILHSPSGNWSSSLKIADNIALTTSKDILTAIAQGQEAVNHSLIALGYAGWGEGQLEQELTSNSWLSVPADPNIIFSTPIESRWQKAMQLLGIDLTFLSNHIGHA